MLWHEGVLELNEIITAIEKDEQVKAVVFDSAVERLFPDQLRFACAAGGVGKDATSADGFAGVAGHAGPPQPRPRRLHSLDQRPRNRS